MTISASSPPRRISSKASSRSADDMLAGWIRLDPGHGSTRRITALNAYRIHGKPACQSDPASETRQSCPLFFRAGRNQVTIAERTYAATGYGRYCSLCQPVLAA
jgi:hypothetical protein